MRNLLRNIKRRSEHPSLFTLEGQFADVPAVLVAAGPSLDRNIHLLRQVQDDVLIICVNTSLKALLKANVKPHLVMSLESLNVSSHFKGDDSVLHGLNLVLDETCHPSLFDMPAERIFTFLESSPAFLAFAERATQKEARGVCVGGSIANAAFSCANMFGCNPIILIGQDLAYTNNQVYASGTVFEDITLDTSGEVARLNDPLGIKQQILDDTGDGGATYYAERRLFPVTSWDRTGTVMTSMDFNLFRYWFQEAAAQVKGTQDVTLINATEGGSYIENFEHITLAEAFEQYVTRNGPEQPDMEATIAERHASAPLLPASWCQRAVEGAQEDCVTLEERAVEALELLDGLIVSLDTDGPDSEAFGLKLVAFEQVEETLKELGKTNSLVEACIHQQINTILDRGNPLQESDDRLERWSLHLQQSREVLEAIRDGAQSLLDEIDAVS
ncbi:MAG: 6-hydroxymethylpterin diphosphokinase MptE-like protein [Myxococcota bacterium]